MSVSRGGPPTQVTPSGTQHLLPRSGWAQRRRPAPGNGHRAVLRERRHRRVEVLSHERDPEGAHHLPGVAVAPHVAPNRDALRACPAGVHDVRERVALRGALWAAEDDDRDRALYDDLGELGGLARVLELHDIGACLLYTSDAA